MQVKYMVFVGNEAYEDLNSLLKVTRERGVASLRNLVNSDSHGGSILLGELGVFALVMVGGRHSIINSLVNQGNTPAIWFAKSPYIQGFTISAFRKHRIFGKDETCVRIGLNAHGGTGAYQRPLSPFIPDIKQDNAELFTPYQLGIALPNVFDIAGLGLVKDKAAHR